MDIREKIAREIFSLARNEIATKMDWYADTWEELFSEVKELYCTYADQILAIKVEEDRVCDRVGGCMFMMFGYSTCKCKEGYLSGRTLKQVLEEL